MLFQGHCCQCWPCLTPKKTSQSQKLQKSDFRDILPTTSSHGLSYLCASSWAALGSPSRVHCSLHGCQVPSGWGPSLLALRSKLPQMGDSHRENVGNSLGGKNRTLGLTQERGSQHDSIPFISLPSAPTSPGTFFSVKPSVGPGPAPATLPG